MELTDNVTLSSDSIELLLGPSGEAVFAFTVNGVERTFLSSVDAVREALRAAGIYKIDVHVTAETNWGAELFGIAAPNFDFVQRHCEGWVKY